MGALERDEWLRAAWRVLVAHKKTEPKRLVFSSMRWVPTLRFHPYVPGDGVESGHGMRCLETLRQEHYATFEHEH